MRVLALLALALLLVSCSVTAPHQLDGVPVTDPLAMYPETHQVVIYWYESCPYCEQELAEINEVYWELKRANVEIIALNVGDSDDLVRKTVAERGYLFPVVAGYTMADLPAVGVPYQEIYLNQKLTAKHVGYLTLTELGGLIFLEDA